ncbi:MAG: hypothetical protein ACUVT5_02545 [Candidatus Bathyarchaeales archaeon]
MKNKITLAIVLLAFMMAIPVSQAAFTPNALNLYLWMDKPQYNPGETVTLYITFVNDKSVDIVVNETKIECPWYMYVRDHWEGNYTFNINRVIKTKESYSTSTTFTIPNDGRVSAFASVPISVAIKIDGSFTYRTVYLYLESSPTVVSNMDTLILLMAVLIILIVVCTALIAGAIFLSARKPPEACEPSPPPQQQAS